MDRIAFVDEYARRFNQNNVSGDLTPMADLRTDDAVLVWRAPDMPEIRGRIASAGEAIPVGATIAFSDLTEADDAVTARLDGAGFPRGAVTGIAKFEFEADRLSCLTVELDHPLR